MIDLFVSTFRTWYPKGWRLYDVMRSLILLFNPVLDHVISIVYSPITAWMINAGNPLYLGYLYHN